MTQEAIQKTQEQLTTDESDQLKEYNEFVKSSVADGTYFKDALDWYLSRYVNPLCDRTIMIFVAIAAVFSLYFLWQIIGFAFPLVQKVPVVIKADDQSRYTPYIRPLKDRNDKTITTVDESVAKYLLTVYVEERESYDYRKSDVNEVTQKFNRIKNISSFAEYKNFQAFMSKDNPDSPTHNFGHNVYRTVTVDSVNFIKPKQQDYYQKIQKFLISEIPTEAEIKFSTITRTINDDGTREVRENYLAKVIFNFTGLDRNAKSGKINFMVSNYKLFRVK